jgi:hypothetical protein
VPQGLKGKFTVRMTYRTQPIAVELKETTLVLD